MSHKIKLNQKTSIDLPTLVDSRLLVQANSGGGKSWLLRRILEQSHGRVQQIVIDLEGEFSTLREKYDYVLAGKDGDTPAEPKSASLLARRILELNVSAIVDLYELHHQERKRFTKIFLESLVNAPKKLWHPCLVIVDEAHVFCPEKGQSEASESVIDLATRGRKRGYCAILATQRLSKLHKDAAAECNNKLIDRTGLDIDRKRASEELGFNTKEQNLSLRSLAAGEFYAFGPALSTEVKKVKVGNVITTHPKAGKRITKPTPPTKKIMALLKKIKDLPEESEKEAKTIAEHRQKIIQLKRDIGILKREKTMGKPSQEQLDRAVKIALNQKEREMFKERTQMQKQIENFFKILEQIGQITQRALKKPVKEIKSVKFKPINTPQPVKQYHPKPQVPTVLPLDDNKPLTGGAKRMVEVLVSKYPMSFSKSQLATFARLSPRSGTYSTYLSRIRSKGLIIEENGMMTASQEALDMFDVVPEAPASSDDLIQMWRSKLNGGARRMFDILVESYPSAVSKEELGFKAELEASSGTFGTYLSRLRSNGLIEVTGDGVKASENLFI